ncbi:MAG TPA: glycoside hydrolase family 43 protein [Abditibacterium sp.]|jgi:beta-xylosidase
MMRFLSVVVAFCALVGAGTAAQAQQNPLPVAPPAPAPVPAAPVAPPVALPITTARLTDIRMRDACVLADAATQTYYMVASAGRNVRAYTSKDLVNWTGPNIVFRTPPDLWPGANIVGIWAPELQAYKGKYYLFLTFNTDTPIAEQWHNWLPRVRRASQILVSDSPLGPFKPFQNRPTTPIDMMTLDGTLWVEDGVPYMVFCNEWVQVKDGTVDFIRLKDDLSESVGEPVRLFNGSDGKWAKKSAQFGSYVTDGPYLYRSKVGKLLMIWSGFSETGYTVAVARSTSGKLAGPWEHQPEPLFSADGGHAMIFKRFDGQLMLTLHSPNQNAERIRLFELEDLGDTLRIKAPFGPQLPTAAR